MFKRGYIFDLDGTLVNSYPEIHKAFALALAETGEPPIPESRLAPLVGTSMSTVLDELFPDWLDEQRGTFRQTFGDAYDSFCHQSLPFEGAGRVLDALQGRYVIVSNKPRLWSERLVTALGWQPLALICPGATLARKPSPDMLIEGGRCLRNAGNVETILTIGDSLVDQLAAKRANLPFFQVAWSYHRTMCDGVVTTWAEFLSEIDTHAGGSNVYLGASGLSRD